VTEIILQINGFWEAYDEICIFVPLIYRDNSTYEAVGPHFQGNPYNLKSDILLLHGLYKIDDCPRTFEGIRDYLENHAIEGIVFWKDGEPRCKIKRSDFGFKWPCENAKYNVLNIN